MALRTRRPTPVRALVASARTLTIGDEKDALSIRRTRQPWQQSAWAYRDAIGELGYAMRFLANSLSRMKLYAAAYDPDDPQANPVPISEAPGVSSTVADACSNVMQELGAGQLALSGLIKPLVENMEIPGECFLVSDPKVITDQLWSIRSMDEIQVQEDGTYLLRDEPDDRTGGILPGGRPLSPDAYCARIWTPHPRWHSWADSPMRQLIDTCDELLLLSRSIRAISRSRLTGPGILAVAEEMSLQRSGDNDNDDDPNADAFMDELTQTIMESISDEGSAASVAPIIVRAPYSMIKDGMQHFAFDRKFDDKAAELRSELIGRIATGIDLPKEVVTGTADLNHWSSWQIDDNTFRHHVEPKVLTMVDGLTVAFLRPALLAEGVPADLVDRIVVWYDPVELVTHPDRTKDALDMWDRNVISDEALREVAGFDDDDKPGDDELLLRMLYHTRTYPPNIVESLFHHAAPSLEIIGDAAEPGVGPGGVQPPALPPGQDPGQPNPANDPSQPQQGPPPEPTGNPPAPTNGKAPRMQALVAAGVSARASRQLANLDRDLRTRLVTEADAALRRTLERAGNRARAKAPNDVKRSLAGVPATMIPATLGKSTLGRYGLDDEALLDDQFDQLHTAWNRWVDSGNRRALGIIVALTGLSIDDPRVTAARQRQDQGLAAGWAYLADALRRRARDLLYNPDPNQPTTTPADTSKTLAGVGMVRGAVAVAAGFAGAGHPGVGPDGKRADGAAEPVPGLSDGPITADLATSGGATIAGFVWEHGDATHEYEPHLLLDGTEFTDWSDEALAPGDDASWLGVSGFYPGDHDGCTCSVTVLWTEPADGADTVAASLNGARRG